VKSPVNEKFGSGNAESTGFMEVDLGRRLTAKDAKRAKTELTAKNRKGRKEIPAQMTQA
jgi:hypothetical protein